jgi:two-component system, LytTR family, response regulator
MISCIIIEDEHLAAAKLAEFVGRMEVLSLQRIVDNGADAISYLISNQTDLIFLDIRMEDLDGMQVLKALANPPRVIITSAESSYALSAFEYNVSDYLLKPFGFDRFVKAVTKVADELAKREGPVARYIFVKTEYRSERVDLDEIQYIEGMKDYLAIVLGNRKLMTLMSFNEILQLLPSAQFMRIHKSYIVAFDKIRSIEKSRVRIGGDLVPVSDTYREQFFKVLKIQKNIL